MAPGAVARAQQHLFDRRDDPRAFVGQPRTVDVAREQGGAGLPFEIIDPATHGVDREPEPVGRGAEAAAANDFQEDPRRVPI